MTEPTPGHGRTDKRELTEVIKAFLNEYTGRKMGMSKTRIQKVVYYADLYCLHEYGRRLTDADFKPYYHGSYSETIDEILEESPAFEAFESRHANEPQYRATESAKISQDKQEIVDEVFAQTKDISTSTLAQFSKQSWLYENTRFDTEMDFDRYQQEALISPTQWRDLSLEDRNPVAKEAESVSDLVE